MISGRSNRNTGDIILDSYYRRRTKSLYYQMEFKNDRVKLTSKNVTACQIHRQKVR
jgi:hypothetical protein